MASYNSNDDGFGRSSGAGELNFAAPSEDEAEYPAGAYLKKGKVSRQDPMSHRIIEKRRRDRMNNCLADLSRLIPPEYLKKGRGRVEKTEIIEMAIRHLKYLQDRAHAAVGQGEDFRAGYQEASAEAVRYLVEVHGYGPGDGLCVQLAAHLHRHCDHVAKVQGEPVLVREKPRSHAGSSSETASSSSSAGYKPGVIATAPPGPPMYQDQYESDRPPEQPYPMDCDRVSLSQLSVGAVGAVGAEAEPAAEEPLPLDGRRKREPTLRTVRKPEHNDDYLHSYKFKNSIERRFSRSQDNEASSFVAVSGGGGGGGGGNRVFTHKRRRQAKPAPSTSTSQSGSTEDARDTSPQDTSSESPHHHQYEKPPTQYVPVFALNSLGKYYVPLSVEYACVARHLGPYDVLDARGHHAHHAPHLTAPLHPVTIHVNFQPCLNYHVKREPSDNDWRPV